jgi:hypothetical protein
MGQQQLLMVVLTMILVGVAIVVGQTMFEANAIQSEQTMLTHDLMHFATKARGYYWRPSYLGGAHKDFRNIVSMNMFVWDDNDNGRYYIESAEKDELVIVGVGRLVIGGDSVRVRVAIDERRSTFEYLE